MKKKPTLAVVILTYGATSELEAMLVKHASYMDEIIIVNSGSHDAVVELAGKYAAAVIHRPLNNDFAAQRNAAFEHITADWTFFLDSDELPSPKLWTEIRNAIETDEFDALTLSRLDVFLNTPLQFGEVGQMRLLRVAKTHLGAQKWQRAVHEIWNVPTTRIKDLQQPLLHRPHPTIASFLQKLQWYASLEPQARKPYGRIRVLAEFFVFPMAKFIQNYIWRQGFRDGAPGLIHALCMSYYSCITRVYLYEAWHT